MDLFDKADWKKEREARLLVKRGHATIKELLILNYGEWPLRGLNIVTDEHLNQEVSLSPMHRYFMSQIKQPTNGFLSRLQSIANAIFSSKKAASLVVLTDKREIFLNHIKLKREFLVNGRLLTHRVLAHELRHIQQFDPLFPTRAKDLYGSRIDASYRNGANVVNDAVSLLLEDSLKDVSSVRQTWEKFVKKNAKLIQDATGIRSKKNYFTAGIEIQALLEELFVHGYPHWPRMPTNHPELYAALIDAGLQPPRNIMADFQKTPGFPEAQATFKSKTPQYKEALSGLQQSIHHLPNEHARELFWTETLPILYADIIESFGDREGRSRMQLGCNQNLPALLFGKDIDACHEKGIDAALNERIASKVAHLNIDHAAGFITSYFELSREQQIFTKAEDLLEGDKRFILSFVEAPGIKQSLISHQSPLATWLDAQAPVRSPSSPAPIAFATVTAP
ncbi:MAG: hypothetical protein WCD70_04590 [Alphaproteobacteria bacterium]